MNFHESHSDIPFRETRQFVVQEIAGSYRFACHPATALGDRFLALSPTMESEVMQIAVRALGLSWSRRATHVAQFEAWIREILPSSEIYRTPDLASVKLSTADIVRLRLMAE